MAGERVRLYVRGSILGYKRSKVQQHSHTSLIKIDGVESREETDFYAGKRIAFIYKAKTPKKGTLYRCIWGKVRACGPPSSFPGPPASRGRGSRPLGLRHPFALAWQPRPPPSPARPRTAIFVLYRSCVRTGTRGLFAPSSRRTCRLRLSGARCVPPAQAGPRFCSGSPVHPAEWMAGSVPRRRSRALPMMAAARRPWGLCSHPSARLRASSSGASPSFSAGACDALPLPHLRRSSPREGPCEGAACGTRAWEALAERRSELPDCRGCGTRGRHGRECTRVEGAPQYAARLPCLRSRGNGTLCVPARAPLKVWPAPRPPHAAGPAMGVGKRR